MVTGLIAVGAARRRMVAQSCLNGMHRAGAASCPVPDAREQHTVLRLLFGFV